MCIYVYEIQPLLRVYPCICECRRPLSHAPCVLFIHMKIYSKTYIQTNTLLHSLTLSRSVFSYTLINNHSQIQLQNFTIHKFSIHTYICYDFMTRKNFPIHFSSLQHPCSIELLWCILWKWKTNRVHTHIFGT